MIERIYIIVNGATVFAREFTRIADPVMSASLLASLRRAGEELAGGELRQAQSGDSTLVFWPLPGRAADFVAVIASLSEGPEDLAHLARLISEEFATRYSDSIPTWDKITPFKDFQPVVDLIIAEQAWSTKEAVPQRPRVEFDYRLSPRRTRLRLGEELTVTFKVYNSDTKDVSLESITNALPEPFFGLRSLSHHILLRGTIFLHRTLLPPRNPHQIVLVMTAERVGEVEYAPILHLAKDSHTFTAFGSLTTLTMDE